MRVFTFSRSAVRLALQSRAVMITGVVMLAFGAFGMCSLAEPQAPKGAQQPKVIDAPELVGGTDWLNTDKPLKLADLRGRIVLLDFWTLCCINCIHTLPDLARLEARYPFLVVIGIHSPKFENEKKTESIRKAILRYEIKHPVYNDADKKLWNIYGVNWWPTLVLIDPDGKYRGAAPREGNYDLVDKSIAALIKEFDAKGSLKKDPVKFQLVKEEPNPLYFPGKVLADSASKRVFIADSTNHRIVITDLDGKKIAIAGTGKDGLKDGKFDEAQFSDPQGMALDGETLYVADRRNHAIRALNLKTQTVKRVAGTGEKSLKFGKPPTSASALKFPMASPWDVLYLNKRLYIAIAGHNQIWTFDPAKETMAIYAGNGDEDLKNGSLAQSAFAQPSGLATDGIRIFVADSETSSIRIVPRIGINDNVSTIVGKGLFDFGDVNGVGVNVRLQHALGVAYLGGKVYVADTYNSKIKVLDPLRRSCENWLAEPGLLNEPGGISISGGKMYIADTNNHRIQVVDMKTKDVTPLRLQGVEPVRRETASRTP
jgi:DNA-binding beta-propeller fold protein YncE